MADADREIDELFQLPLDEFTPARNALAKRLGSPTIKDLQKPSVAAWAVNQVYWQHRPAFEGLVKTAERLRAEHRKLLAGKTSGIREAEQAHRAALREAVDRARRALTGAGQAASPATMTAVAETLEALPGPDAPGRLTRPLKPLGFAALSGASFGATRPGLRIVAKPPITQRDVEREKQRAKEEKEEQRRVEREAREAKAKLARAEGAVKRAREAVEKAEQALDGLRARLEEAKAAHHRARLHAKV